VKNSSRAFAFAALGLLASCASLDSSEPAEADIRSVPADLVVPPMTRDAPEAGARVRQVHPDYKSTSVYHALYLPPGWQPGGSYPVIVEYQGNGGYRSRYGDVCTGRVEDSKLGYGMSAGANYIWLCLPYLNEAGTANAIKWWGDAPSHRPGKTIDYCKKTVPWICETYGGDPDRVVLAGFSRGSIACNYIGLADDEIARLWCAFVPYSVYDGNRETWPYPGADRASALERLRRLGSRPQFICSESSSPGSSTSLESTRAYLASTRVRGKFTFRPTGYRNHNDAWILRPGPARKHLRRWLQRAAPEASR
jgi:hypothetical protein